MSKSLENRSSRKSSPTNHVGVRFAGLPEPKWRTTSRARSLGDPVPGWREAAALLLLIDVPRFGSRFRELEFEVVEQASGRTTKLTYDFLRAQGAVYGVTTMRVPLGRVTVERPGSYLVRVCGLKPGADYSRCRIMFSRPYLGRMVLQIIGIVICAIGMLLSLLLALWQVLPLQRG